MRGLLVAACVVAVAFAGCSSEGSKGATVGREAFRDLDLQVTKTTGLLLGVAYNEALVPIPNVKVRIVGPGGNESTTATKADGTFAFDKLPPGPYAVFGTKPGFFDGQTTQEVRAGVADPPIVRLVMKEDAATRPYAMVLRWDGYIECSGRIGGVAGVNACSAGNIPTNTLCQPPAGLPPTCLGNVTGDNVVYPLTFEQLPDVLHAELVWQSNQAMGTSLTLVVGPPNCADIKWSRSDGPSPRIIQLNATQLEKNEVVAGEEGGLCYRVFNWTAEELANTAGLTLQQKFTVYFVMFFNFEPTEGYSFSEMGEPVPPA